MKYGKSKYRINGRIYTFIIIKTDRDIKIGKCSKIGNREIELYGDHIYDPDCGIIKAEKIEDIPATFI